MGILLVDDEPVDIVIMQRSLERAGYDIFAASNYAEFLDYVGIPKGVVLQQWAIWL